MSTFRSDLSSEVSALALDIFGDLGTTVTYSHKGAQNINLVCMPGPESKELAMELGCNVEESAITFEIPTQTGFILTGGLSVKDVIVYNTYTYYVNRWSNPDSIGAVYNVDCVRYQAVKVGTL